MGMLMEDTGPDHAWLPFCCWKACLTLESERMVKGCEGQAGLALAKTPSDNGFRMEESPWES